MDVLDRKLIFTASYNYKILEHAVALLKKSFGSEKSNP